MQLLGIMLPINHNCTKLNNEIIIAAYYSIQFFFGCHIPRVPQITIIKYINSPLKLIRCINNESNKAPSKIY